MSLVGGARSFPVSAGRRTWGVGGGPGGRSPAVEEVVEGSRPTVGSRQGYRWRWRPSLSGISLSRPATSARSFATARTGCTEDGQRPPYLKGAKRQEGGERARVEKCTRAGDSSTSPVMTVKNERRWNRSTPPLHT